MRLKNLFAVLAFMLVTVSAAVAQSTTSGITGRVTDASSDPLPGVIVTATHKPSGTVYRSVTNAEGFYNIVGMRPGGPYELEASSIGFEKTRLVDIQLKLGDRSTYNMSLQDSDTVLREVVITANRSDIFNSQRTGAASNFTSSQIVSTPSISKSIFDIAKLTPQAVSFNGGSSFAGASNKFNSFQIDGTVNNDVFGLSGSGTNGGQSGANPISLEAIQELQVVIAPFDVRQSGFTGGGINAITKSGTNTFRASAYNYYYNQDFFGKTPGKNIENRTKLGTQSSNIIGATLGGPLVKDKLFFFTNIEYASETYPSSYNAGEDSDITKEEADRVIEKLKSISGGYDGGGYGMRPIDTNSLKFLTRLDWNINDRHNLTLRYNLLTAKRLRFSSYRNSLSLNNSGHWMNNNTHSVVGELNSRLSDKLSNELRIGYTRVRDFRELEGQPFPTVKVKLDNNRSISLGAEPYSVANGLDQDILTISDNLTLFMGRHTMVFGTHNEFFDMSNLFIRNLYGNYEYATLADFLSIGTPAEAMPISYSYSYSAVPGNPRWASRMRAGQIGFYAQDDWDGDFFSMTFGLRVDMPIYFNKPSTNEAFNSGSLAREYGVRTDQMPKAIPLFSPRWGFRWHLDSDRTMLLRGGIGVFTGRIPFVWLMNSFSKTGIEIVETKIQGEDGFNGLTDFRFQPDVNKQYRPDNVLSAEINVVDKNFKFPQVLRTNLAYEHMLPGGVNLTLEGIFSKSINDITYENLSYQKVGELNQGTGDNRPLYKKRDDAKAYTNIIYLTNNSKGYSYNLSAKLEKSFAFGLNAMLSYSYGRSMSVNDGGSSQAYSGWQYNEVYYGDSKHEVTPSDFDSRHRVIANLNYRKEYAKHFATTVGLVYNGQSGRNFSMIVYGDLNGDGSRNNDLMYVPTEAELPKMPFAKEDDRAAFGKWIADNPDIAAYRGTYIPRNSLAAAFENHIDLHLAQDFMFDVLGRKHTIQVNADIVNFTNLLNPAWGLESSVGYNYSPLGLRSGKYTFKTPNDPLWSISNVGSRWHAQIGLKYIF